ncbi:MAG TPA: class I SAM-dependent methyltransferase [Capillimicrobium sp.]|nr:class I SAM-dependent methyltransferase [Capillimicrobium sp.]
MSSERIAWAVERLNLQPHHRVLEAGCGHGVAVSLIADRLDGGSVLAIDRSPKMIQATARRNAAHVAAGVVTVQQTELADADLGDEPFDRVLAIHLPVLQRGDAARELALLRAHMAPDGELHVSFQPHRPAEVESIVAHVRGALEAGGFAVARVEVADLASGRAASVVGRPA